MFCCAWRPPCASVLFGPAEKLTRKVSGVDVVVGPRRKWQFRDRRSRIEKDVVRTDRGIEMFADAAGPGLERLHAILLTYSFYNFDLSYCQGMSDLAAPLLLVMEDEVEAFWCFQQLMQQVEPNFHKDQNGMHRQLEMLQVLTAHLDPELLAYLQSKDCSNFYFCFRWLPLQALAPLLLLFLLLLLGT